jgi:hypothetical protein
MKNKRSSKLKPDDIGGAFSTRQTTHSLSYLSQPDELDSEEISAEDCVYPPVPVVAPKKHSPKAVNNRLKAQQIAQEPLVHLSDDLLKLANEIRYLNPLIAEVLDEAWDATEEAIALLSDETGW